MRMRFCFLAALLCGLAASLTAGAVSPSLTTVLPRGVPRGAETEVTFVGANLADAVDVMFHDPGIELVSITPQEDGKQADRKSVV